ncbi:MAG: DUF1858 domain-containing protein [Oscillospiraceae bacterium]
MEKKQIDLSKSVYELCNAYPDVVEILQKLGFTQITKPGMLDTMGRFMTIPKGAQMKGIDIAQIEETFLQHGYEVVKGE